jgi:hypothetical protein
MGAIPWSPELANIIAQIKYYRGCYQSLSGRHNINARTLHRLRKNANIPHPIYDLFTSESLLRSTFDHFRQYKQTASTKCTTFLNELAHATAAFQDGTPDTTLKQLMEREHVRSVFRHIHRIIKPERKGVAQVEAPLPSDNTWHLMTERHKPQD